MKIFGLGVSKPKYLLDCEYWVFGKDQNLPDQATLIKESVHKGGFGKSEGLLFSDIRFHLEVARRDKNPHVFRPDLFDRDVEPSADILSYLADANSFIRARYLATEPCAVRSHVGFLPHLALHIAKLSDGGVIFDQITREIWTTEDFAARLKSMRKATADNQVRLKWNLEKGRMTLQTLGLVKIGFSEWQSEPLDSDQKSLAQSLLSEALDQVWEMPMEPKSVQVSSYGDDYVLSLLPPREGVRTVAIGKVMR